MALAGVVGQVGCLTMLVILVSLIAGLWLDRQLNTQPLFALVFVLASIPVTLYLMFRVVLSAVPRIQTLSAGGVDIEGEEEPEGGGKPKEQL
jgi:hypothetical protein